MKRLFTASAALAALVVCNAPPTHAAPPTVTPSPGYDARLQEQRRATATSSSTVVDPVTPPAPTAPRHHTKGKKQGN
jgi:hypothetical protein